MLAEIVLAIKASSPTAQLKDKSMLSTPRRPKIFIVSSNESRPVSDVMMDCLKPIGTIVPWYRDSLWEPGKFILQILLEQAPKYDFAVIIFGRDDKTVSREKEFYAPRDNVIFEAGLFMAHLGHTRTFIVAPKEQNLKILSDLAGLALLSYDEPTPALGLVGVLKPLCQRICKEIKQQKIRHPVIAARPGPASIGDAHSEINKLLIQSRESTHRTSVLNIALDMEYTWGLILRDHVMKCDWPKGVTWRSLMIDSNSPAMKKIASDTVSVDAAEQREKDIKKFCDEHGADLKRRNIDFQCRAYTSLPSIHGFAVNRHLYVSFCRNEKGKLLCAATYLSFCSDSEDIAQDTEISNHYIDVFNNWFAQHWEKGRRIWPC